MADNAEAGPSRSRSSSPRPEDGATSASVTFKKKKRGAARGHDAPLAALDTALEPSAGQRSDGEEEDSTSIADLLALRALNRKPTGIELEKLNKGVKKKKKKQPKAASTDEDRWKDQMAKGGLVKPGEMSASAGAQTSSSRRHDGDSDSDSDDNNNDARDGAKTRRRVRQDNFQGETNVIDVDKHMMAYIEAEMSKRRGGTDGDTTNVAPSDITSVLSNPEDELYKVAEKYTRLQNEARNAATSNRLLTQKSRVDDEEGEGNVGLSSAMLSGIPEVELGMDSKLRNIEATEKAKQELSAQRAANRARSGGAEEGDAEELLAGARFFNPRRALQSDAQAIAAKRAAEEEEKRRKESGWGDEPAAATASPQYPRGNSKRREMATDEQVMQRFKKRQMNNLKR